MADHIIVSLKHIIQVTLKDDVAMSLLLDIINMFFNILLLLRNLCKIHGFSYGSLIVSRDTLISMIFRSSTNNIAI